MNSSLSFQPVQGSEAKIKKHSVTDGNIYFATDTGKMYLDANSKRISVGGAGAAIYYASSKTIVEGDDDYWLVSIGDMVNKNDIPTEGDIILNVEDGAFFKVESITNIGYQCSLLSLGGGSTGPAAAVRPTLYIDKHSDTSLINGSDFYVYFTATSAMDENNRPLNEELTITWTLTADDVKYQSNTIKVPSGEQRYLSLGGYLRPSATSTLTLVASGANHEAYSPVRTIDITTTELTLECDNFNPYNVHTDDVTFTAIVNGKIDKILDITFNGKYLDPAVMSNVGGKISAGSTQTSFDITIPIALGKHGGNTLQIDLYQYTNDVRGQKVTPIYFEIPFDKGEGTPIVWLGNYSNKYYTYDSIQIPYLAYDPNHDPATIHLFKNGVWYEDDVREIEGKPSKFAMWEIVDAEDQSVNTYEIACGTTKADREASKRTITFTVEKDIRDLTVAKVDSLRMEFNPKGRSNSESKLKRQKWSYTNKKDDTFVGQFENFNWKNNGWMMDPTNNQTFLRISNGAKFTIPLGETEFAGETASTQSNTFEMRFKIRNIANYSDLIQNITRYTLGAEKTPDDFYYEKFEAQNIYTNYDAYLQWYSNTFTDPEDRPFNYDDLQFARVEKKIDLANAICKYYDTSYSRGWAFGAQDAFFSDGKQTVSVAYVEDEIVTLSMVYHYNKARSMILFYLNGVISGISFSAGDYFNIDSNIVFNSTNCDIDLYSMRVYPTNLDVYDIVKNYTVDNKDIDNFDALSVITKKNTAINEYQIVYKEEAKGIVPWNEAHPGTQTMPYIIFDTTNNGVETKGALSTNNRLPNSKKASYATSVTFVNNQLDYAYATGELEQWAIADKLCSANDTADVKAAAVKTYYKHHCPSWTGDNCELVVQGTSSEFYPRRNYKIKTKTEYDIDEEERIHIFLNKGPFAEDYKKDQEELANGTIKLGDESTRQKYWYMNNYTNGTHKWTMKVDFMESSGSYNAGFASMVGNAYTQHPLEHYLASGAIDPYKKDEKTFKYVNSSGVTPAEWYDEEGNFKTQYEDQRVNLLTSTVNALASFSAMRWNDYRTSLLGFPVMAFHKKSDGSYTFIGYYRMLLDKGSDEVLGFKPAKTVTQKFIGNGTKDVRKKAECWEFSNNNRTYCSYRDPEDRVELSFKPSEAKVLDRTGLTAAGVPIVADSFEYRYNDNEDYLDILYKLGAYGDSGWECALNEEELAAYKEEHDVDLSDLTTWDGARNQMLEYYKNWEDACKWVWSTCLDNVISMAADYTKVVLGDTPFSLDSGLHLRSVDEEGEMVYTPIDSSTQYDPNEIYWVAKTAENGKTEYVRAYVYNNEANKYEENKYYIYTDGVYSLSSEPFDGTVTYYNLIQKSEEEIAKYANLLVAPATEYNATQEYYTYDPTVTNAAVKSGNLAVNKVGLLSAEDFAAGTYYVPSPVKYSNTYYYDTQEYRAEKFKSELSKHFNIEYMATYFIMTEAFECYDSRGKNCMMATWGPLQEGGEYIWYPIFYDIDTQLGINNTGIPSFTFNVDVTLANNFSTSDSVLWNNFYSYFKSSYIKAKYLQLKGDTSQTTFTPLQNPPLQSIDNIEEWYLFDSKEDPDGKTPPRNIAARGLRPLIATNLDAWYKYITITNNTASSNDTLLQTGNYGGYLDNNTNGGVWTVDGGTYFYALQGDRKQSRQAFLKKRLDYIDSWLNVGNYARAGGNNIWGRVSANSTANTSDEWLEPTNPYYDSQGNKNNEFDAEYWLNLKPVYSTYVTISDDSAAYPSQKYDGSNPVKMYASAIESGVRSSVDYNEQLLYIYGSDSLQDIGDMSNLYWREFKINGKASKLTRLKLGHDALDKNNKKWFNKALNQPSFKASSSETGLPLLKEMNLCNITINAGSSEPTLDLTSCEKLENFRATGSNLTSISFADGVSLNTLYLPSTITSLKLSEANLLTKLIKTYVQPTKDYTTNLVNAEPGLFIEGLFDTSVSSKLTTIDFSGGGLKYGSFDLVEKLYKTYKNKATACGITATNAEWCPYIQVIDGDAYDENLDYFIDNTHYKLEPCTAEEVQDKFSEFIVRGELYYLDKDLQAESLNELGENKITADAYSMLEYFASADNKNFHSATSSKSIPNLSGVIYINNSNDIKDEASIAELQAAYPNMTFFLTDVKQAYSAQFVIKNDDGSYAYVPDKNGDTTNKSIQKISADDYSAVATFESPFASYAPHKNHYTFVGWCLDDKPDMDKYTNVLLDNDTDRAYWGKVDEDGNPVTYKGSTWGFLDEDEFNYIYQAIFTPSKYTATFINTTDNTQQTIDIPYSPTGNYFHDRVAAPVCANPTELEYRYAFKGWTKNIDYAGAYQEGVDITDYLSDPNKDLVIQPMTYYAIFVLESVYKSASDAKYFSFDEYGSAGGYKISLSPDYGMTLSGKVTLPVITPENAKDSSGNIVPSGKPIVALGSMTKANGQDNKLISHYFFMEGSQYTTVLDNAFVGTFDPTLVAVYLPNTITSIGKQAFYNAVGIETITLNDNIVSIGDEAFASLMGAFPMAIKLNKLPTNLTSLGAKAFGYAPNVRFTDIPVGITEILDNTFISCKNVAINEFDVTSIGDNAFNMENDIDSNSPQYSVDAIYLNSKVGWLGDNSFKCYGNPDLLKVYVANESLFDALSNESSNISRCFGNNTGRIVIDRWDPTS